MDVREKLVNWLCEAMILFDKRKDEKGINPFEVFADHLIANGVTIQKWIPVSDLPKESGMYIVTVEKLYGITYSDAAYFDAHTKKWGTNTYHYSCDKVTYWMPLPEPAKE